MQGRCRLLKSGTSIDAIGVLPVAKTREGESTRGPVPPSPSPSRQGGFGGKRETFKFKMSVDAILDFCL